MFRVSPHQVFHDTGTHSYAGAFNDKAGVYQEKRERKSRGLP